MSAIQKAISALIEGQDLNEQITDAFEEIMTGEATQVQTASFLTALHIKGETPQEIAGCASVMRDVAVPLQTGKKTLEIVGTGGDRLGTFNISTASAIVCAAAGVPTTKHGNRALSSKSGAADCLEALGIKLDLSPEESQKLLDETDFCFLFAPVYHNAMRFAAPVRKELAIPTVFNILGPLTNPAKVSYQLLGVYDESLMEPLAQVLKSLGVEKGMVVHGKDGADEITLTGETDIIYFDGDSMTRFSIKPEDFGYSSVALSEICGASAADNAEDVHKIFSGEKGAKRNVVCMNAGAALYLSGKADSLEDGIKLAESVIDEGLAKAKLDEILSKMPEAE